MRNIARIVSNSDQPFNPNSLDNDWEILKLSSELELNAEVFPACLPSTTDYLSTTSTEESCFTSGWGTLSSGRKYFLTCFLMIHIHQFLYLYIKHTLS